MVQPSLFLTSDGSHSLRSETFQVPYHSIHGAIQESQHVFMEAGFQQCLERGLKQINVLEMGFGTGLNAYLCLLAAAEHPELEVHYYTIEQFPISMDMVKQLNYPAQLGFPDDERFFALHQSDCYFEVQITENFFLHKQLSDLCDPDFTPPQHWAHTVFFDAFAPESQPQLWEEPALKKIRDAMAPGGNFVTYCAKGIVKRRLKALGLSVSALPGPPGKREMTRAVLLN